MEKEVKRITNQIFCGIAYDIAGMHFYKADCGYFVSVRDQGEAPAGKREILDVVETAV
ncbi:hypothetical protein [uncultured Victivallis sp.]|uniref:hypothetical protein n=1 Tax=uncultured Victivallis sp. TaxID=354118 RepID=UPI0025F26094|nr:hypothetical protein [uncultured Victivallis sp.]